MSGDGFLLLDVVVVWLSLGIGIGIGVGLLYLVALAWANWRYSKLHGRFTEITDVPDNDENR